MVRLLQLLIFGHSHQWEVLQKNVVNGDFGDRFFRFTLRCTKCGDVKMRDLG